MELKVYSTIAGAIPMMVRKGEPECFVPYAQALELQAEVAALKAELAKQTTEESK